MLDSLLVAWRYQGQSQTPAQLLGLLGQPGYSLPAPPSTPTPNPLFLSPSLFLPSLIPMPGYWDFQAERIWDGRADPLFFYAHSFFH